MFRPAPVLTLANARSVLDAGLRAVAGGQTEIDLAGLSTVDSSAIATLLAWQRAARRDGKRLVFRNFPANLLSLGALYGVNGLLQPAGGARADLPHH